MYESFFNQGFYPSIINSHQSNSFNHFIHIIRFIIHHRYFVFLVNAKCFLLVEFSNDKIIPFSIFENNAFSGLNPRMGNKRENILNRDLAILFIILKFLDFQFVLENILEKF